MELHALAHLSTMACPLRGAQKDTCRAGAILLGQGRREAEQQACHRNHKATGWVPSSVFPGEGAGQPEDGMECDEASADGACS